LLPIKTALLQTMALVLLEALVADSHQV